MSRPGNGSNSSKRSNSSKETTSAGMKRFEQEQLKNIAAAKKITENYVSSSDEDEEVLDENTILNALYQHYKSGKSDSDVAPQLEKTAAFLENALHSGSAACLICIGSVRRTDAIWTCKHCYCFFHLNCARRWANNSIMQLKSRQSSRQHEYSYYNNMGVFVQREKELPMHWCCPQCRKEYRLEERPSAYKCFCGKEVDPKSASFLLPHSCGEICGKQLKPKCGHTCMLLCHPGPCPPCAQYANVSCLCGRSPAKTVRCVDKEWKCDRKCTQLLNCGEHVCNQSCHQPNKCPPCNSTSMQHCECGREVKKRSCSNLKWQCKNECGSKYTCGVHICKRICHSDNCGQCPLSLPRSCPCGKNQYEVPCTETIEPCMDTCQKLLPCGIHACTQRCHRGDCNLCIIITKKKCRCGLHERELPCWKSFTCETKCKQMRDCGKHPCNKKCCDGQTCPPCDKICGKPLTCQKHKCQSVCHEGPCYPCDQRSQVNCPCGKTSRQVPCGRERSARVMCPEWCRLPSKCHHPNKHLCHKHECPPCSRPCGLPNTTTGCSHLCSAKCHSAVKIKSEMPNSTSSVWQQGEKFEFKCLPHPPCERKVSVTCIGGHEIANWPCWNSKPTSCQRKCNRMLRCGNHKCELICHAVPDITDMKEQMGCASCEEGCNIPRPPGCIHQCMRPCHLPPCNPCDKIIKSKCHCGLTQVMYKCAEFFNMAGSSDELKLQQDQLKCCGNRCLKNLECGHRCMAKCHPGKCPSPEMCRKKVRIFCECKRLKIEVSCDKHRAGHKSIPCDNFCVVTRAKQDELREIEAEKLRQQEEAKNRIEVEQFEKKFTKKKFKERKIIVSETKVEVNWKLISIYAAITAAIISAIVVAFYAES